MERGLRLRDRESSLISNCIIGVLRHTRQGALGLPDGQMVASRYASQRLGMREPAMGSVQSKWTTDKRASITITVISSCWAMEAGCQR